MRKYKTTWDEKEVNQLARDGYILHTAVPNNGLIYYVMEWKGPEEITTYGAHNNIGTTQFGDH